MMLLEGTVWIDFRGLSLHFNSRSIGIGKGDMALKSLENTLYMITVGSL